MSSSTLIPPLSGTSLSVQGRVFVITGGTQGLGLAIARLLKQQGATGLALVSRSDEKGQAVTSELSDDVCKCVFVKADLSNAQEISRVIPKAVDLLKDKGPITGLVNAAATTARGNLMTETAEGFDLQMAINVRAPFLLTQAVAKHMKEKKVPGSIVNICSCAVYGGAPFVMAYSVSKAALATMTRTNAHELARDQIRVNGINMGWCYTDNEDKLQSARNPNWLAEADTGCPLGRILRPHDVATTVNYLLSDASAMMTASVLELHPEFAHGMLSLSANESEGR